MIENPQKENGYTAIANEIMEALSRTNLSPYESRLLWCILRKTYGYNKKEDWVALSQLEEMTGMRQSHISRSKKKLIQRNILTQTGNKIALCKFYSRWKDLPKQVTVTSSGKSLTQTGNSGVTSLGNWGLPKQGDTKVDVYKSRRLQKQLSWDEMRGNGTTRQVLDAALGKLGMNHFADQPDDYRANLHALDALLTEKTPQQINAALRKVFEWDGFKKITHLATFIKYLSTRL